MDIDLESPTEAMLTYMVDKVDTVFHILETRYPNDPDYIYTLSIHSYIGKYLRDKYQNLQTDEATAEGDILRTSDFSKCLIALKQHHSLTKLDKLL